MSYQALIFDLDGTLLDTNTDMQTAQRAGLASVGVTWGFRDRAELRQHHASFIIDHPDQLLPLTDTTPRTHNISRPTNPSSSP